MDRQKFCNGLTFYDDFIITNKISKEVMFDLQSLIRHGQMFLSLKRNVPPSELYF